MSELPELRPEIAVQLEVTKRLIAMGYGPERSRVTLSDLERVLEELDISVPDAIAVHPEALERAKTAALSGEASACCGSYVTYDEHGTRFCKRCYEEA